MQETSKAKALGPGAMAGLVACCIRCHRPMDIIATLNDLPVAFSCTPCYLVWQLKRLRNLPVDNASHVCVP